MLKKLAKRFGVNAERFKKCPAVMTGGKANFWHRATQNDTGRDLEWIVWDRIKQDWTYRKESYQYR